MKPEEQVEHVMSPELTAWPCIVRADTRAAPTHCICVGQRSAVAAAGFRLPF